jgi:RND family efflux transporter MFP subunit
MDFKIIKEKIRKMDKKIIYAVSLAVALTMLGIGTLTFGKAVKEPSIQKISEAPVSVTAIILEPTMIDSVVSAAGVLNSKNTSMISSKIMGKVVALTVNEGDHVEQGKLLIKIESGEIIAQAYQARAAFNNAKLQFDRIKGLFDQEASTQMEMDQATLGFESAQAGLNAANAMESYTNVTAPISGQVIEKRINLGEMALPGQPILKIEDNRHLMLEVTVKEQDIRFIELGKAVTVQIDAIPGKEIKARVGQVVPASDMRTHSFIVKIDVPAEKGLITGMYGKAIFSIGSRPAILVPRSAIVEMSGLLGVYLVAHDNRAVFQMIQPGEIHGDRIEAVTGLKAEDKLIVSNQATGIDGRKIVVALK